VGQCKRQEGESHQGHCCSRGKDMYDGGVGEAAGSDLNASGVQGYTTQAEQQTCQRSCSNRGLPLPPTGSRGLASPRDVRYTN
jgi:hypothetical protein